MKLSKNAITVLKRRYLLKDEKGCVIETPEEMFIRVARAVAKAENADNAFNKYSKLFYKIMTDLKFLPNSPTLMNAGKKDAQLAACFTLPIEDNMASIFEAVKNSALIHKSGGGVGHNFSKLRAKGSIVKSTKGVASGPVSFIKVFDAATEAVKQGGIRRGANLALLSVQHPDIIEFIKCKEIEGNLENFNISVALTDEFIEKVKNGDKSANSIFDLIIEKSHSNGEPGVIFIDEIDRHNPTPQLGRLENLNPCSEQPLFPYESCVLGSINLAKFVQPDCRSKINYKELAETVKLAVRFLDNVIEINHFPLLEIEKMSKSNRKIGLGVMGWADMLAQLSICYDSMSGIDLAKNIMRFIDEKADEASMELAEERGVYPNCNTRKFRNATRTTLAPTGSISIIADCSSGIEPYFALAFKKNVADTTLLQSNKYLKNALKDLGLSNTMINTMLDEISNGKALGDFIYPTSNRSILNAFRTANEISPEWHVKMQAAFQKFTNNAVSKTINMPNSATRQDVRDAFLLAHKLKCKGLTIYRNNSRVKQVLEKGNKKMIEQKNTTQFKMRSHTVIDERRPETVSGQTTRKRTGCGQLYITINYGLDGKPFELFCNMGKNGGCEGAFNEAIGRLVSLCLKNDVKINQIVKQLTGLKCGQPFGLGLKKNYSCADAVAKTLKSLKVSSARGPNNDFAINYYKEVPLQRKPMCCPDCGNVLRMSEGCRKCLQCGYSACK